MRKNEFIKCVAIAGAYISCCIGAGFSTGQEVVQFFISYGYWGILGLVGAAVLFAWYGWSFMKAGQELKAESAKPVLEYFCGKKIRGSRGMDYDGLHLCLLLRADFRGGLDLESVLRN